MNSEALLIIEKGSPHELGMHTALQQGVNVIGRRTPQTLPDISFSNPVISRHHCIIRYDQAEWLLSDSASRHGTWLNDVRIEAEKPVALANGDRVSLSEDAAAFRFFVTGYVEQTYDLSGLSSRKQTETIGKVNNGISVDLNKLKLMVDNQPVTLSVKEWQLLSVLYKNKNKVVPYEDSSLKFGRNG